MNFESIESFLIDCLIRDGVPGALAGFHGLIKGCFQLDGTDEEKFRRISDICDIFEKYFH